MRRFRAYLSTPLKLCRALAGALVVVATLAGPAQAQPLQQPVELPSQQALQRGNIVALVGSSHLWAADENGILHWIGDTRALVGRVVNWDTRVEWTAAQIRAAKLGDPWLSAGLLKAGDPIYLVKWEVTESQPRLLHIQSIQDVELFGINSSNYGSFILDSNEVTRRSGFAIKDLKIETLVAASSTGTPVAAAPVTSAAAASGDLAASLIRSLCTHSHYHTRTRDNTIVVYNLPSPVVGYGSMNAFVTRSASVPTDRIACDDAELVGRTASLVASADPAAGGGGDPEWFFVRSRRNPAIQGWAPRTESGVDLDALTSLPIQPIVPLHPDGKPDLAIDSMISETEYPGRCPSVGTQFTAAMVIWVTNRGSAASPATFKIRIKDTGNRVRTETFRLVRGIEPGETIRLPRSYIQVELTLDPLNEIAESDETNNKVSVTYGGNFICVAR